MAFEKIIGQEKIINGLRKNLELDQVPHAYLLEGKKGLGKKMLALELSKALVCTGEKNRPCNQCSSCIKVDSSNHPEIELIQGNGSIKIEMIRQLQKDIQLKPYEGSRKVYIIDEVEKMTIQSQNALLKTLEEPPPHATLILLTTNVSNLLPTIVSRCQVLKLSPVAPSVIHRFLIEQRGIEGEKAQMLAAFSAGAIGQALQLYDDEGFYDRREMVIAVTKVLLTGKLFDVLEKVAFFEEQKEHIEEILDLFISWYRDLLVYKETEKIEWLINIDKIEEIQFQGRRIDLNKLRDIILIIEKSKNNLKSNVQFQLNIEVMLLNIQEVLSKW